MPLIAIGDIQLHFELTGRGGPAIVLVHGGCCAAGDWRFQAEDLTRDFRVLTLDLRGHGRSSGSESDLTVTNWANDIDALIDALAIGPAILVGHSLGTRIVMEAASRRPENALGLVLIDGSRVHGGLAATAPLPGGAEAQGDDMSLAAVLDRTIGPYADAAIRAEVIATMSSPPEAVMWKALRALEDWDRERADTVLADLPAELPVLAIQSTYHDRFTPRRSFSDAEESSPYLDHLRRALPRLLVRILPETGHFSMLERPGEVTDAIRSFALAAG